MKCTPRKTAGSTKNITVAVRVRPLNKKEQATASEQFLRLTDVNVLQISEPSKEVEKHISKWKKPKRSQYAFDLVFFQSVNQTEVFEKTTKALVHEALNGFNATIFAYGATGAGKTFTMLGTGSSPGIIPHSLTELFSSISRDPSSFLLKVSFLEIYNELAKDLLSRNSAALDIREDSRRGVVVAGLSELIPRSSEEVLAALAEGTKRRVTEATDANEVSSRSHAVLIISVEHKESNGSIFYGKLSLVDLAGSERASNTNNRGLRLLEGANINRSLLSLGNCINALVERSKGVKVHVPYRDSKLTRLLKDSLNGNCKTAMIACVSPSVDAYEDTSNTIKYANRAKNITVTIRKNVRNLSVQMSQYHEFIDKLHEETQSLKNAADLQTPELELNQHLQEEIELTMQARKIQDDIDQLEFQVFSNQFKNDPTDSLREELRLKEERLSSLYEQMNALERRRSELLHGWVGSVPEQEYRHLKSKLKSHLLRLRQIESETQIQHNGAVIKQKDMLIEMLSRQLRIRDKIIHKTNKFIKQNRLDLPPQSPESLQTINQLTRMVSLPKLTEEAKSPRSPIANYRRYFSPLLRAGNHMLEKPERRAVKTPRLHRR